MNIIFTTFVALEKAKYIDLFEEKDYTEQEYQFAQAVKEFREKRFPFTVEKCHEKFVFTWKSKINQTLGCMITKKSIEFSNPIACCDGEMHIPTALRFPKGSEKEVIIQEEIKQIKELLLVYSEELENYFH